MKLIAAVFFSYYR